MPNKLGDMADTRSANEKPLHPPPVKPMIIGVFGVTGSGKTTLMHNLEASMNLSKIAFFEGSEVVARHAGGLQTFKSSNEDEKLAIREAAIISIQQDCIDTKRLGIVTGHSSFWREEADADLEEVITNADLNVYTHVLYLDPPADVIEKRVENDTNRPERRRLSAAQIRRWQDSEKKKLRELCYKNGIVFSLIQETCAASYLVRSFHVHNEEYDSIMVIGRVIEAMSGLVGLKGTKPDAMLVIDGDKTLAAEDTGELFWKQAMSDQPDPLQALFRTAGYSHTSFHQAILLYRDVGDEAIFDALCSTVASQVTVRPEFINLLQMVAKAPHVGAIVVTCGLRLVWQKVLTNLGLSEIVRVVGSGPELSDCIVTPRIKADVVKHLQESHNMYVWVFGDSPLDLPMLKQADQALVVVGEQQKRSKSMEVELKHAIDDGDLRARQILFPGNASPLLDTSKLPIVQLVDLGFMQALKCGIQTKDATTRTAAKLLMTPTRDATVSGPALRKAHRKVGLYLATEFLSDLLGVQEIQIRHVQGGSTNGYCLVDESSTTIIAVMRGGEPMAFGVSDAFPQSVFLHAHKPEDIELQQLKRQSTVILVDSVVNNGETMADFVQHLRKLRPTIRIVVVTGVVQADGLRPGALLEWALVGYGSIDLITLRISQNKYTGRGGTDTGARLFNTTRLEE